MSDTVHAGRCNCGAVRVEVAGPFIGAGYCHCGVCRRRTGTAAAPSALAPADSVHIIAEDGALGAWTSASGSHKVFCARCGSAIASMRPAGHPRPAVAVRMGLLDGDPGVVPSFRQFTAFAAPWEAIPDDGLPRFPEAAPPSAWEPVDR
ncbi:MAG: GFA family protein [Thermoleophilia bacterium]|nr:GFA family protein [Thermoleophilia bacterium]